MILFKKMANFNHIDTKHAWLKGIQVLTNKGQLNYQKGDKDFFPPN